MVPDIELPLLTAVGVKVWVLHKVAVPVGRLVVFVGVAENVLEGVKV